MSKKCETCAKSVYPMEALNVGELAFHKGCFKCSACGARLTIEKYVLKAGKVLCPKCNPLEKSVGTAVTWETENAKRAEALKKDAVVGVKNIILSGERGTQSSASFFDEQHKKNAAMRADANKIRSVVLSGERGTQSGIDRFTEQAMKLQKQNMDVNKKGSANVRSPGGEKASVAGTGYEFGASPSAGQEEGASQEVNEASEAVSEMNVNESEAPASYDEAPAEEAPSEYTQEESEPVDS